jgi:hypothetical protein
VFRLCLSHLIYTVRPCLIHTCHAVPLPCHDHAVLNATSPGHSTARHESGMGTAWYAWISIGRPQKVCGRPARVRLLPATTHSSTYVVTRSTTCSSNISVYHAKDSAPSENGRVAAWHVCINAAWERHGMYELASSLYAAAPTATQIPQLCSLLAASVNTICNSTRAKQKISKSVLNRTLF